MAVTEHPGPNGELFFAANTPAGHPNPARFESLQSCLFPYRRARRREGWTIVAAYVTDYSSVDYRIDETGGQPTISAHTARASFADATALRYVVESDVHGAMGTDFLPFADAEEANTFAADWNGRVVAYDDIGPALFGS
jgi:nitrous oxide reductase accessory protein NosL